MLGDNGGNDGDDRQESRPDIGDPLHDRFQIFSRPGPRSQAGDKTAIIPKLLGHVLGTEYHRRPEVAEKVDQDDLNEDIRVLTYHEIGVEKSGEAMPHAAGIGLGRGSTQVSEKRRGENHQRTGENDGHDAGMIDPERKVMLAPAERLSAPGVLGLLNWDPPLSNRDEDRTRHHEDESAEKKEDAQDSHLARSPLLAPVEILKEPHDGVWHPGNNARGQNHRDAVADAVLVNLLAQPHQEHASRSQPGDTGQVIEGDVAGNEKLRLNHGGAGAG